MHNPRAVFIALIGSDGHPAVLGQADAQPRAWQPFDPGDEQFTPLTHAIAATTRLPADMPPGSHMVGLWLPDAAERLRLDPRYAVRFANRDVPWWTTAAGEYGVNVLGTIDVSAPAQP
jgi:hypothetical protein